MDAVEKPQENRHKAAQPGTRAPTDKPKSVKRKTNTARDGVTGKKIPKERHMTEGR